MLVTAKRVPVEQQKKKNLILGTGSIEDKEYHHGIINDNEIIERVDAINTDSSESEESF